MPRLLNALKTKLRFTPRGPGALLALSLLATACQSSELEDIPLQLDRTDDTLRISWEGDKVHFFHMVECRDDAWVGDPPCGCNGTVVWALGAAESEQLLDVARQPPFLSSPIQYGVRPEGDRRGETARPLVKGKTYVVNTRRVEPCKDLDCAQATARGCQSFIW